MKIINLESLPCDPFADHAFIGNRNAGSCNEVSKENLIDRLL
jgi:hypothetical protein